MDRSAELAEGGRVAVPLAERGVGIFGIELSRPMIDRLRTKAGETDLVLSHAPELARFRASFWLSAVRGA
ncbi:hypothetical protein ACIA5G_19920 [Amycolatopsis sp. NPDC051758]|uniref:hypothetical protein n=1 Tax=Amycolatopsis sp. NPDC051758 TaxID=3363935 RepID=UPI00379008AF